MRKICSDCHFLQCNCLCHAIQPVDNQAEIIVLQHPKETSHAKNTVKLLALSLRNLTTYVGISESDFNSAKQRLSEQRVRTALVYPTQQSIDIASCHQQEPIQRLVFIDGSWRQAYAIWMANSWLHTLPSVAIDTKDRNQRYHIRKTDLAHGFSTLEAVAYALSAVESTETQPLLSLLDAFTQRWCEHLPQLGNN